MSKVWKRKVENAKFEDRELIPVDSHPAVLVALIDIGHQETKRFNSSELEWVHKIVLVWELTARTGHPLVLKDFRLSLASKAGLRKFLEGWRGRDYNDAEEIDLSKLLGQTCLIKIAHSTSGDRTFHGVESASLPTVGGQKIAVPAAERKPFLWSVEDGKLAALPEDLPFLYGKSLAERVEDSQEYAEETGDGDEFDPDAPAPATATSAGAAVAPGQGEDAPF